MANYFIRKFEESDHHTVKEFYARGLLECVNRRVKHFLASSIIQLFLVCTFAILFVTTHTILFSTFVILQLCLRVKDIMANYFIRKFEESDHHTVKEFYARGLLEYVNRRVKYFLASSIIQLFLVCTFAILFVTTHTILFSTFVILLLLAAEWIKCSLGFRWHIKKTINEVLFNIRKTFLQSKDSCFYVVICNNQLVGMYSISPSKEESSSLELNHVYVKKGYRRLGIARALCLKALDFACARKYRAVVLNTMCFQYEAQKLYESIGFQRYGEILPPGIINRIINFSLFQYRYDICMDKEKSVS
uniref:N-acetyltransferase domain-containing protein n=1 Tax=Erpetoichthys calabaricus TaxID=27687 RepID=A0A8C4RZ90_ERPCA